MINNKIYIGQTIHPQERWRRHKRNFKSPKTFAQSRHLYGSMIKYGVENFTFEIVDQAESLEDIDTLEIACIAKHDSANREHGYNITLGGNGKRIISDETKQLIRKARIGTKATEITKQKMSTSMLGKNAGTQNGMYGKRGARGKITLAQANDIRQEYSLGKISMIKLAKKYDLSKRAVLNIIHNRSYKI